VTRPTRLTTARLVLDQPALADVDAITGYCDDPLFERFLTTPWPYRREHAVDFVTRYVPDGWRTGRERTWSIRRAGVLVGVVGWRAARSDIGFWLGAPFRGAGIMPEAVAAVLEHLFATGATEVLWEAVPGNTASAAVARRTGFSWRGVVAGALPLREGGTGDAWTAAIRADDPRVPADGWPVEVLPRA
jgi:RimJ/RimL family protein N-acetyltransferase